MFFPKKRKPQLAIVVTALVAFFPGSYMAQGAATTNLTFIVNPFTGGLSINVPAAGDLGSLASPDTVTATTGQLDTVTVTDTRRGTLSRGWITNAISTDLVSGLDSITASNIGYAAGVPTIVSGSAGVTENTRTGLPTSVPVNSATTTSGNHVVSWRPIISITLKDQQLAGTYVGTMTHSVA
jgi:hypothetical protein